MNNALTQKISALMRLKIQINLNTLIFDLQVRLLSEAHNHSPGLAFHSPLVRGESGFSS
jgi:hypothetical protein